MMLLATTVNAVCPVYAPFFGSMGVASSLIFTGMRHLKQRGEKHPILQPTWELCLRFMLQ